MNLELMMKVRELVVTRPELVRMDRWATGEKKKWLNLVSCGTVCCIAGHAIELSGGSAVKCQAIEDASPKQTKVASVARQYLGIDKQIEGDYLFFFHDSKFGGKINNPYHDLYLELFPLTPGTQAYANVVAKAIDRCMERNTKPVPALPQLEAQAVEIEDQKLAAEMGIVLI